MDLDFTPEQEMLREAVAGVCARHCGLDVVRQMEDDPIGYSDKFWQQLADLGLLGMTLPEEHGGSGMTMLDAVVVYTELGRALAPSPHFVSSVMSGGVLARRGPTPSGPSGCRGSRPAMRSSRPRGSSRRAASGRRVCSWPRPPTVTAGGSTG